MDVFKAYIRQHRRLIIAEVLGFAVFICSFCLYHLPIKAVLYPTALCVLIVLAAYVFDFIRTKKRHDTLSKIRDTCAGFTDCMPDAEGIEDADYQEIIRLLCKMKSEADEKSETDFRDMVDYYTAWVHQIKTPIASMRLHLQNEDSAQSRKLQLELSRIEQYVEMVLTFLRLDSDSTDYVIKKSDLDGIIRPVIKKLAGDFISRKIKLDYAPVSKKVLTDEKWLSFVIEQVVSNALKYTPSGTISIYIKEPFTLCIKDTGIGIAPEDMPRIFEKGYTGYNGRSDKKASGIGLYLCRRICSNLGHTISADSRPGEGTTVYIDLDRKENEPE